MPNTDVTALLSELDALPHRDREARFARAVRGAHAGAPDATGALVDELAARGRYGRRLAALREHPEAEVRSGARAVTVVPE